MQVGFLLYGYEIKTHPARRKLAELDKLCFLKYLQRAHDAERRQFRLRLYVDDPRQKIDVHNGDMLYDADTEGMACSEVSIGDKNLQLFHDADEYVLIWQEDSLYFVLDAEGLTESEVTLAAMSACPITSTNQQE